MKRTEILKRLAILERITMNSAITAVMASGERKKLYLKDCDFLEIVNSPEIVSFEGERNRANGRLIDLLNGLKECDNNETEQKS